MSATTSTVESLANRRETYHEADVVVVGAGVFGCAIAFALANQGRSVILLERWMKEPNRIVGELLPKLPGLPGPKTPGWGLGDLLGPPEEGSIVAKADMAAVQAVQMLRTPELDDWARHLDEKGVAHSGILRAPYATVINFRDPDGIALELSAIDVGFWTDLVSRA